MKCWDLIDQYEGSKLTVRGLNCSVHPSGLELYLQQQYCLWDSLKMLMKTYYC